MKWKVATLLVLFALPGVLASSLLALPLLVDVETIPVSLETLQFATALQSTVLVSIAAFVGAWAAPKVGLSAPAVSALIGRGGVKDALRPQLVPGILGGCLGAAVIVSFYAFAPTSILALQGESPMPLIVRVLYGGITEEVLVRWGLMTAIAWVIWRVLQRDTGKLSGAVMWPAILISAVLFGISHLPAFTQVMPDLSVSLAAYVILGNAAFGVIAGYLFWRYGLEAAVIAHVLAHVLAFIVRG